MCAFDLDPNSNAFTVRRMAVTAPPTTRRRRYALRSRQRPAGYVWHDSNLGLHGRVGDLSFQSRHRRKPGAPQLRAARSTGLIVSRNNEGLALTSVDECAGGIPQRTFLTTDGGGSEVP